MDGLAFVQMIELELAKRNIPKERFYKESGISSATMSQWRKRIYSPSSAAIKKIEEYLGITFTIEQKENKKAPTDNGERSVSDDEIKFALWGDCEDVSDDDLADVRRYAAFVRERKKDQK
ncbi:MAG: helix-turn-helix transcriptional regulator [Ruminococcaceae bacterium]|nr:helix-turn-helix transcriptional regulator [Oscillospiraceae bacterium]